MSGLKPITVNTPTAEEANIYAEDDASVYLSMFGGDGVSTNGQSCKATVLSNNKVRIADGIICVGGHFARIPYGDYIDCEIENGQSGKNRNDIIVARFETTGTGGIDTYTCEVKKGTAGTTATDPEIVQEDLYKAGKVRELPLYRVKIEGLSITAVEQLFTLRKTNEELEKELESLNSNSIIKSGHNDNGYYRKYADGTLEMWGSKRFDNINMQTPDNWNYYCGGRVNVPLPMESKTWVSVIATAAGSCAPWISIPQNGLGTELFQAWIYSSNKSASETITIFWRCFGTWK